MSRPFSSRASASRSFVRVNGKIRAREIRVIDGDGNQLGIMSLGDALTLARSQGVDLVEVAPNAAPPVCRLVDYGKFRYEQAKRDKESRKHQHATKVKEVQLSPKIDPHDLSVKLQRAIEFLCEDMKVKIALRFRGREMAHTEIGFEVVQRFLASIAAYGQPDFEPKLVGRGLHVMISPLPRNKRPKAPPSPEATPLAPPPPARAVPAPLAPPASSSSAADSRGGESRGGGFVNNPFSGLDLDS